MPKRPASRAPSDAPLAGDTSLRAFLGYRMKRAYMVIQTVVSEVLDANDMKITSFSALAIIIENPGLTQTALAQALQMERSSVVVIVDTLENRELITRNKVETDRRQYALMPTLRGKRLFDQIADAIQSREKALVADLAPDEQTRLMEALSMIERGGRRREHP